MTLEFTSLTNFTKIFIETLNKYTPIKKRYIGANHAKFFTKVLPKAIVLRSRLPNIFLKEKIWSLKKAYQKQRNICVKRLKKLKKNTLKTLTYQKLLTTRSFGKLKAPFLATK